MAANTAELQDLLYGEQGRYGYLFPYRNRVPTIKHHIFTDLKKSRRTLDQEVVERMLDLNNIGWTAKVVLNLDLFPLQIAILQMLWNTPFPMLVAARGGAKSFSLAVYAILRALLDPGSKVVIIGAGLRQARLVFSYIETIWNNAPVLRDIVGSKKNAGPRQNVDLCYFRIGDSIITALPLGDGCVSKHSLLTYDDGFDIISRDYLNNQHDKSIIYKHRQIWGNKSFRQTDESYCNGKSQTKKIRTHHGFEIEGTHNHKLKIVRDKQVQWIRMDEMQIGDRILLDRSVRWHRGQTDITEKEAYAIGLLIGVRTKDKQFPAAILKSSRKVTSAFISGLFDSDGNIQVQTSKGGTSIAIGFTNTSKELVIQLQYILLHYGIVAHVCSRKRDEKWERCYELLITGEDVLIFANKIGFRLKRKQNELFAGIAKKKRWMDQKDDIPNILETMIDIAKNNMIPWISKDNQQVCAGHLKDKKTASRPLVEKFIRVYGHIDDPRIAHIRCLADPDIYYDEIISIEDSECVTFDVHVPDGHEYCAGGFYSHNTKIRGFRATSILCDEFACLIGQTPLTYADKFGCISDGHDLSNVKKQTFNRETQIWGNGLFRKSTQTYCNGIHDTKKILTGRGRVIEGTHNHMIRVLRNYSLEWTRLDAIEIGDYVPVDRSWRWHSGQTDVTKNEAYAIGLLVGDGNYTRRGLTGYCSYDQQLLDAMTAFGNFTVRRTKPYEMIMHGVQKQQQLFDRYGFKFAYAHEKMWPTAILGSSRDIVTAFIQGLMDTDGHVQRIKLYNDSYGCMVRFASTSKSLVDNLQYILLHYGIISHVYHTTGFRKRPLYVLTISGTNVKLFYEYIGFRLVRKQKILQNVIDHKRLWKDNVDYIPDIKNMILSIISDYGPLKGCHKSKRWDFATLSRVKHISRERATQFLDYYGHLDDKRISTIRSLANGDYYYDRVTSISNGRCVTYDTYVPDGNEYCANGFYSHNSIPSDIFDIVVRGFAATTKTPIDEARRLAFERDLDKLNFPSDIKHTLVKNGGKMRGNQIVYSGTAYYAFNHFAKRYEMWQDIIKSKGDPEKISQIFGGDNLIPEGFDYRDYAVIRIPYNHLPDGLLDQRQLAHAKAILPRNIFLMEHGAIFVKDSDGFFPRSLIEGCTVGPNKPIETPDGAITFTPLMRGQKNCKYVAGIDPAAERDNLAIVVEEVWANHSRVVYCWAVNKKEFINRKKKGLITEDDYYAYCCARIREITQLFNLIRIEMDSQGGGYAIAEMLRSKKLLDKEKGDFPIYEVIDFNDPKSTDGEIDGRHILHLVKPSSEFNQEANIALHKGLETRSLLFPAFDSVKMYAAIEAEKAAGILFDTFEENVFNLEELKNELCTIQMSETATGKEKFDTPQVVQPGAIEGRSRKGRLRKDRYTALLLSYKYIYDTDIAPDNAIDYENVVGNFEKRTKVPKDEPLYRGPGVGRMRNSEYTRGGGSFGAVKRSKKIL